MSVTYVSRKGIKDTKRNSVDILNNLGIIFGGSFTEFGLMGEISNGICKIKSNGEYDDTFITDTGFSQSTTQTGGNDIKILSDGTILIAGSFTSYRGTSTNNGRLTLLNSDGSKNNAINIGNGFGNSVLTIEIQSDGKILCGGVFTTYQNVAANYIIRLNSDGSRDNTFNIGTGFNNWPRVIKVQTDGKILCAGEFTSYNGTTSNRIIRLNTDGSIDNTFNIGTGFGASVYDMKILESESKILVCGFLNNYNGTTLRSVAKLNFDGSVDTGFISTVGASSPVYAVEVQPDGKIIAGGNFSQFNNITVGNLVRLNIDATVDTTFNANISGNVNSIVILSDGKLIVGGEFSHFNSARIVRLNSDGTEDTSFNVGRGFGSKFITNNGINKIAVTSTGDYILTGSFTRFLHSEKTLNTVVNRIGVWDNNLNQFDSTKYNMQKQSSLRVGFDSTVNDIHITNTGKLLLVGNFSTYQEIRSRNIILLNSDGSIDSSFNTKSGFGGGDGVTIKIQSDGKIVVGGLFTSYNGTTANRIIRLNTDGSIDNTFNIGTGFNSNVGRILIQTDGKIIVVGGYSAYNGTTANRIIRLNTDGSIDNTFNIGTGFNGTTLGIIELQSDGKILAGGNFTSYNETTANRIIRLNSDGSRDNTFNIGTGFDNTVIAMKIQSDGKIVVGGLFTSYNGTTANRIIRLNTDGSIDNTFNIVDLPNSSPNDMIIQSDGKIIIVGNFISCGIYGRSRLARFNVDGSIDNTFKLYTNSAINTISLF